MPGDRHGHVDASACRQAGAEVGGGDNVGVGGGDVEGRQRHAGLHTHTLPVRSGSGHGLNLNNSGLD